MTWQSCVRALALGWIVEGRIPLTAPEEWLESVRDVGRIVSAEVIRKIGLGLLLVGVGIIWLLTA